MSNTHLVQCIAPCTIFLGGNSFMVDAGELLKLTPQDATVIVNGPYKERFVFIGETQTAQTPQPLVVQVNEHVYGGTALKVSGVAEQLFNNAIQTTEDNYTPPPAGPKPDDLAAREAEATADELMRTMAPKHNAGQEAPAEETLPEESSAEETAAQESPAEEDKADDTEAVDIPLNIDAHWSAVRQFILDKEAAEDPKLKLYAQAVIDRYPTYTTVLQECRRILGVNT